MVRSNLVHARADHQFTLLHLLAAAALPALDAHAGAIDPNSIALT
jgi:hypothetical protein